MTEDKVPRDAVECQDNGCIVVSARTVLVSLRGALAIDVCCGVVQPFSSIQFPILLADWAHIPRTGMLCGNTPSQEQDLK